SKKDQERQIKRYLNEQEKSSVLNRTRQDLGLSPRAQTNLDSIVESYLEGSGSDHELHPHPHHLQLEELIDEEDDHQTKWTKVEKIFSLLPDRLPDLEYHHQTESFKSVASPIKSHHQLKFDSKPIPRRNPNPNPNPNQMMKNEDPIKPNSSSSNLRQSETLQRNHSIRTPQEQLNPIRKTLQLSNSINSSSTTKPVSNSNHSSSGLIEADRIKLIQPVLVPQPWGKARDQRRLTQVDRIRRESRSNSNSNLSTRSSVSNLRNSKKISKLEFGKKTNKHLSNFSKGFKTSFLVNQSNLIPPVPGLPKRFN
ncbi:hypothetical protein DFH28DRAFT_888762, partial [Melampsora americana]